jgi:TonB family protein
MRTKFPLSALGVLIFVCTTFSCAGAAEPPSHELASSIYRYAKSAYATIQKIDAPNGTAVLRISLDENGYISKYEFLESSGSATADNQIVTAFYKVCPFPLGATQLGPLDFRVGLKGFNRK